MQLDAPLIEALHARGFDIAVETNGTVGAPEGIDWICVSPKAGAPLRLTRGDEVELERGWHVNLARLLTLPLVRHG